MKVRSCDLRYQITIEEPTEGQDTTGQPIVEWATFATVRAKVDTTTEFIRSTEIEVSGSLQPRALVVFTFRYLSGLTEKMRFSFGGDYYDILAIANVDGRGAYHMVRAVRGLNDG